MICYSACGVSPAQKASSAWHTLWGMSFPTKISVVCLMQDGASAGVSTTLSPQVFCKGNQQYLLTCKVSCYCLLPLHSSARLCVSNMVVLSPRMMFISPWPACSWGLFILKMWGRGWSLRGEGGLGTIQFVTIVIEGLKFKKIHGLTFRFIQDK